MWVLICKMLYLRHVWRWRRQAVIDARRERGARVIGVGAGTQLKAFRSEAFSRSNTAIQNLRRIP